jgi:hypothetical protein
MRREVSRIRSGHTAARRATLRQLIARTKASVVSGGTFDATDCLAMLRILETVNEGRDAREWFAIKPKRGAPPSTRGSQKWIAAHYWALRVTDPKHTDQAARDAVANLWGISGERVYAIARPERRKSERIVAALGLSVIETTVRIIAPSIKTSR